MTSQEEEHHLIQSMYPIDTVDLVQEEDCISVCSHLTPDDTDLAIITIGNSGVGKSFLTNILIGEEVFHHKYSPGSITRKLEYVITNLNGYYATVYNLPGLIEASKENIELNKKEIEKAFLGKSKQIILYIFGVGDGGRLRHEDYVTYLAMYNAYEFYHYTLIFIINNIKPFYSKESQDNYQSMVIINLKSLLKWPTNEPFHIVFAEDFSLESKFESLKIIFFREELVQIIFQSFSYRHEKKNEIELNEEKFYQAKEELNQIESQKIQLKNEHSHEIIKLKQKMEQQRVLNERKQKEFEEYLAVMKISGKKRKSKCFPGNSWIHVQRKGIRDLISMESLRYGDEVQCVDGKGILRYCVVYFFGHLNPNIFTEFVNLRTNLNQTLRLSSTHFAKICVHECTSQGIQSNAIQLKSLYATDVKIGDLMLSVVNQQLIISSVEDIWLTQEQGLYNPYIRSHDLIVNGIVVSPHSEWILDQFPIIPRDFIPSLYEAIFFPVYFVSLTLGPTNSDVLASFLGVHSHPDGLGGAYTIVTFSSIGLLIVTTTFTSRRKLLWPLILLLFIIIIFVQFFP
jgi:GTP-binding protein EngB required for normal cell division